MDNGSRTTSRRVERRAFLAGGVALTGVALAACDALSTNPSESGDEQSRDGQDELREAPMLTELVEKGDLPPLEERLPEQPLVVEPTERPGVYGGELTTAFQVHAPGFAYLQTQVGYDPIVRWDADWQEVIPNVAEFEVNAEGSEYTFQLRRGIKWSDGEPFTADDVVFAFDDVMRNEELSPGGPSDIYVSGGSVAELEKVDDYTVRFVFAAPNGLFLQMLATLSGIGLVDKPRHYLEQFHADYNPDVDELVSEHGFSEWHELFANRADFAANTELPALRGWVFTAPPNDAERVVAERNPYYWKVDPNGAQLPYIDKVTYMRYASVDAVMLALLNGEFGLHRYEVNTLQNKPVIARERESAGYRLFDMVPTTMNTMMLALNLTHENEALREVFNSLDFRIGLSHAIDRQEIINAVYLQQGEPWQASPRPESEFHDEELAKQYTEYDVDRATEHLDRVVPERDGDGLRLRSDGERLSFTVETTGTWEEHTDVLEIIQEYWREVGVDMRIGFESRNLFAERQMANVQDAATWHGNGGLDVILDPKWYFPFNHESAYGVAWADWRGSGGEEGETPPEPVQQQLDLYDQILSTPDTQEQAALMKQILEIARGEFYAIGINLTPNSYGVARDDLHNLPDPIPQAWLYPTPGPTNPEQYFIEQG